MFHVFEHKLGIDFWPEGFMFKAAHPFMFRLRNLSIDVRHFVGVVGLH